MKHIKSEHDQLYCDNMKLIINFMLGLPHGYAYIKHGG